MIDLAALGQRYRRFAETECRGYSSLYHALAHAVADDAETLRFIAAMPVVQPNLFLACIQFLAGADGMPHSGPELRAFVARNCMALDALMRSRRTQTNEVGRCGALLLALPAGPLALVEVGASAGLCLLLDRFGYHFGPRSIGDVASPVQVHCRVSGPAPVDVAAVPHVIWRRGLDLGPVDVRDDEAVQWLRACVWADHRERRDRLDGAIAMARIDPPIVRAGDLVDDLPALLDAAPADAQLVVFHSAVLAYVDADRRQAFAMVLSRASRRRDVVWLSNEAPGIVFEQAPLAPPTRELRFLLGRTRFSGGQRSDELLAAVHPHGAELTWF